MTELKKIKSFVSVVILDKQIDSNRKKSILQAIYQQLDSSFIDYEIVIVEEMSSYDWQPILKSIPSIRVINLSFQVDEEVAITVGLDNMIGDYVVLYNPAQDPIELIVRSVLLCKDNNNIIIGVEQDPHYGFVYNSIRPLFSWLLKEIGYNLPKNSTSFRCLSRTAVNAATRARNCQHQIYVRISQCGLGSIPLSYKSNNNQQRKTIYSSFKALFRLIIFNSVKPLRWMSLLGVFGSICSFFFILYGLLSKIFNNQVIEGWSSTLIIMSFFFSLLFILLAFLGEYMNRLLYEQSRHEPYWVVDEKHSSVMLDEVRFNVTENSTDSNL